ncbi:hypothetical protein R3P38DRAFT_3315269 [Favolaschia claudopus]|uniref:DUF6570 domain-containing protein n=1 Tax=Favolaschia claudopus TaxID=2862362 RepID=A0AAW0BMT1_9AGAR
MCKTCRSALKKNVQPLDSLANFQYYARAELPRDVRSAFEQASLYDLQLVSRSRCSRITHLISTDKRRAVSQGYVQGNVAIFPQDVATVRELLPPPADDIKEAMCALFIGPKTAPTRENIKTLNPVLVSKTRVETMLKFVLENNTYYQNAGVSFSQENLDSLFPENVDAAVPIAIEICCLDENAGSTDTSYADRGDQNVASAKLDVMPDDGTLVLEAVGFTVGENTPKDHRGMKAAAVAWCLDKKNFIKMQTGSTFISDRDPGLLTFAFPGLDPWGIGGFHEPPAASPEAWPATILVPYLPWRGCHGGVLGCFW